MQGRFFGMLCLCGGLLGLSSCMHVEEKKAEAKIVTASVPKEMYYRYHNDDFTVRVRPVGGKEWTDLYEYKVKVDMDTKMGIVTDLKQELRRANSLRVSYAARKKV